MLLHSSRHETILRVTSEIIKEIFKVSLISYLLFYLINDTFTGFVSDYFNITIILWVTIIAGVLSIWLGNEKNESNERATSGGLKEYAFISILSLVSIFLIYYRIQSVGRLSYYISILSGVIIFLISILIRNEDKNEKHDE